MHETPQEAGIAQKSNALSDKAGTAENSAANLLAKINQLG